MYVDFLGYDLDFNKYPIRGTFVKIAKKENVSPAAIRQSYIAGNPERINAVHSEIDRRMKLASKQFQEIHATNN